MVVVLLAGAASVALWALLSADKKTGVVEVPTRTVPTVSPIPEIRSVPQKQIVRRDAEFWPQTPRPVGLRSRVLTLNEMDVPPTGIAPDVRTTWIAQFGGPLDAAAVRALNQNGVEVLAPSVGSTWHVRASFAALQRIKGGEPKLLGWGKLDARDRLMPAVASAMQQERPALRLELYPNTNAAVLAAALSARGVVLREASFNALEITLPSAEVAWLEDLGNRDGVYAIDAARPRKAGTNEAAAADSRMTMSISAPRNLSGTGLTVLVRDEGRIFAHTDFGTRIVLGADVAASSPVKHSTHVAGTIGGSGAANAGAQARGMATDVRLLNYDLNGDDVQEVLDAYNLFGAVLSNHSYGFVIGWDGVVFNNNQAQFGVYGSFARNWDSIVRDNGLVIIKSVGNDRNDSGAGFPHDGALGADGEYYDCVEPSSTGKNYLVVGGSRDGIQAGTPVTSVAVIDASSAGPCDDGRIKPELIANGENVHSCNDSLTAGNEYTFLTGTSMASAVASGAATLLAQRYQQITGTNVVPLPHWFRAVFAQTATDMGRAGPDYLHGFGMLDLEAAVALFEVDNNTGSRMRTATLSASTPERFFVINSDGVTPIRATICWTDAPGDLLASKQLVNDLDLQLVRVSDRETQLPYRLDKTQPHLPATRGVNDLDTIEQLEFTPTQAGEYFFSVRGTILASDTNFTIVTSQPMFENAAPVANITSSTTVGNSPLKVTFTGGTSFDADGSIVRYVWEFGDGQTEEGLQVEHTYSDGSYTARLTIYDDKGGTSSDSVVVAVSNDPPRAVASASPTQGPPPLNVLFSAGGSSDPDGSIVKYEWDFGDGTLAQGETVTHTFAAPGVFFVFLTVTDNGSSRDTTTLVVVAGQPVTPSTGTFALNFKTPSKDTFRFMTRTQLVPPDTVTLAGITGTLYVGTGQFTFSLDERGRYKAPPLAVTLTAKSSRFTASISRANLAGAFASSGAISKTIKNQLIYVPFAIELSNGTFVGTTGMLFNYTASQGRSGRGKVIAP